jgi:hypothetical protein
MAGTLSVQTIQGLATAPDPTTVSIPAGYKLVGTDTGSVYAPGGVLQVVNFVTSDQGSVSVTTADTTLNPDVAITVTPKASGSHFLIQARWGGEGTSGLGWNNLWNIHRDGSRINAPGTNEWHGLAQYNQPYGVGADDNSTPNFLQFSTLDTTGSTAGTAITYRLVVVGAGTYTLWTNRTFGSAGQNGYETFSSELIIMEIAQ